MPAADRLLPRSAWAAALFAATWLTFSAALRGGFIEYDDNIYITDNPAIRFGLSPAGVEWALRSVRGALWMPVTWISFLADYTVWGLDPRGFHLTNVLLHASNAALAFLVFARMTNRLAPSAAAAALFALHPLRVESVAWVTERKDVLSGLFFLLALLAWLRGVDGEGSRRWRAAAFVAFALSLGAKAAAVTLPCVLLCLDVWPLRRDLPWPRLVREKLPLFALSALSSIVAVMATRVVQAGVYTQTLPLVDRVGHALLFYASYLAHTFWPVDLAVAYPRPEPDPPWSHAALAAALLVAATLAAWRARQRAPALLVGWLWFVGMLFPLVGIVTVGRVPVCDRYTYLPSLGLALAAAFALPALLPATRRVRAALAAAAIGVCAALASESSRYTLVWRDSIVLFEHTLRVVGESSEASYHLGRALARQGRLAEALPQLEAATAGLGEWPEVRANLGVVLVRLGRPQEAIAPLSEALERDPRLGSARLALAEAQLRLGDTAGAVAAYREALQREPAWATLPAWVAAATRLAWILATHPDASLRNGAEAVTLAERARPAAGPLAEQVDDALAAAYAETGDFERAVQTALRAASAAAAAGSDRLPAIRARVALYRARQPYREPEAPEDGASR